MPDRRIAEHQLLKAARVAFWVTEFRGDAGTLTGVTVINGCFLVSITVTACLVRCPDSPILSPVVSLKWTQAEAFNEDCLSTATTRGKLVVRSDMRQSADSFRHLCVPGLLSDYVRERIDFTLSESGCELEFTITDKEQAVMPPYGATKADGQFVVVLSGGGAKRVCQVDLSLHGPRVGSHRDLLAIGTRMAMSKLGMESLASTVFGGSFREDLFANAVSLSLEGRPGPTRGERGLRGHPQGQQSPVRVAEPTAPRPAGVLEPARSGFRPVLQPVFRAGYSAPAVGRALNVHHGH